MNPGPSARAEKNVKAAGAGKVALWGVQQADIVYESLLYRNEQKNAASTRLTLLLSDALLRGEKVTCGPVRSLRDASASLREEWQGALAFGSPMGSRRLGEAVERLKADSAAAFDLVDIQRGGLGGRLKGVKAPSNLSVDVSALQARVVADSLARPFAFAQEASRDATALTLDWGDARYLARFLWDEAAGGYLREVAGWPFACYPTEEARMAGEEAAMVQPTFANVIVQWVDYDALGPIIQNPGPGGGGRGGPVCGRAARARTHGRAERRRTAPSTATGRAVRSPSAREKPGSPSFPLTPR